MKTSLTPWLLSAAALCVPLGSATAADMLTTPIYESVPEVVPVEVGNGWYLRGGVSYDIENETDAVDVDEGLAFGAGVGYRFTDYLRGDLTARYSKLDVDSDRLSVDEMETWDLMANAYVDLGTFVGFTPYVGAGAGGVNVSYDDGDTYDSDWRFAYALMAGVAYDMTRNLTLDVGYRYLDVEEHDSDWGDAVQHHSVEANLRYSLW
ncbi:outer membrane protein [Consotaella aegiceratis]|uniref:outer membrane protein n=1 Tax=Consotaella aegiceratis TaxID=3097961 RepID=UPI002F3E6584